MVDPARSPSSEPPRTPRWVKVSAVVVGVAILLFVIAQLTGVGGDHGPGRHSGAGRPSMVSGVDLRDPQGQPAGESSYR